MFLRPKRTGFYEGEQPPRSVYTHEKRVKPKGSRHSPLLYRDFAPQSSLEMKCERIFCRVFSRAAQRIASPLPVFCLNGGTPTIFSLAFKQPPGVQIIGLCPRPEYTTLAPSLPCVSILFVSLLER